MAGKRLEFSLPDLDGHAVRPDELRGQVVLVDIWATWCKPCAISLPFYAKLYRELQSQGLEVLGVNIDEEEDTLRAYLQEHPLPFTILRDPRGTLPAAIEADAMPTAVLLGRDGSTRYVHPGFRDGDEAVVEREIRRALAMPSPGK